MIVVLSPGFSDAPDLLEASEPVLVQAIVPEPLNEAYEGADLHSSKLKKSQMLQQHLQSHYYRKPVGRKARLGPTHLKWKGSGKVHGFLGTSANTIRNPVNAPR